MMKILFPVICLLFFYGCKKEEPEVNIDDLKGKYLVCDSIKTTKGSQVSVAVKGMGTGHDIIIDSNRVLTIYSIPNVNYTYRLRGIKLYYWTKATDPHLGDYFVIYNKTGTKVELEHEDIAADTYIRYYFSAN